MSNDRSSSASARRAAEVDGDAEGLLARWSRLKTAARRDARRRDDDPGGREEPAARTPQLRAGSCSAGAAEHPPLPDPARLEIDSDFSAFLRQGVDPLLRRAALRRLWTLDPVFSVQDGLVEYGEDFTDGAKAGSVVRTALRVREALTEVAERTQREAVEGAAAGSDDPAASTAGDQAAGAPGGFGGAAQAGPGETMRET